MNEAQRAIEEGRIAEERDRMDHAENIHLPERDEPISVEVLETIRGATTDLDWAFGRLSVPETTLVALAGLVNTITAIVEELER